MLISGKFFALIKAVICACAVTMLLSGSVFSQDATVGPCPSSPIQSGPVEILRKGNDAVWVKERAFLMTEKTVITDGQGNLMEFYNLPVPCKADIVYTFGKTKDPVCLKIIVLK